MRGQSSTIIERMRVDTSAFLPLPPAPYDACHKVATRVSSLSLVRYRNNDYSVPTRHGHQEVLAKGYVDRVEIACRGETIATYVRSYKTADFIYNPLHYLALPRATRSTRPRLSTIGGSPNAFIAFGD